MDRPEVLVVAGRYRPGFRAGGPVASVENLVQALGGEFDFRVLALDHDLGEKTAYPPEKRRPEAIYLPGGGVRDTVLKHVRAAKGIVYVQSVFSPTWGILPIVAAPRGKLLIAPRGQFAPGAITFGAKKKAMALRLLRPIAQRKRALWQATAESDAADIRKAAPWIANERILIAPNLPSDPGFTIRRKPQGRLKTIYVGRIDPKKNLLTAVRAVVQTEGATLEVVGPPEDSSYAEACRSTANERISFMGALPPEEVRERLSLADAFLFPTHGENYGHSIVEAMLSGLPSLIGDTTPWRGLEAQYAGFDLPPNDVARFAGALKKLVEMPEEEYVRWSEGARATIEAATERDAAVEASRRMLRKVFDDAGT